jgi:hypothetical protein
MASSRNGQVYRNNWVGEIYSSNGFVCETGMPVAEPSNIDNSSALSSQAKKYNEDFLASASDMRSQGAEPGLDDDLPF